MRVRFHIVILWCFGLAVVLLGAMMLVDTALINID
jgi:hypothetical protein